MKSINKFSGDNMGGIAKIWAVPVNDVTSIEPDTGNVYDLNLESAENIYSIYCTLESISFDEPEKETGAGRFYEPELNAIIPKDTPAIQESLNYISERKFKWLAIYKDNNEYFKLVGEINNPLSFKSDLIIGNSTDSLNRHKIVFSGKTLSKALFINDPFS